MRPEDKRVLIVDDTVFMVAVIEKALVEAGYKVDAAYSGEEALEKVHKTPPDIILLDVIMPGISGFEVTEQLRKDVRYNLIPIIIITGQSNEEDRYRGLEAGADDYVIKPFSNRELLARVHNTLLRIERMREVNPLSGLRGNNDIESELMRRMLSKKPYAIMYFDLNAFKPYNDIYGFAAGDEFIRMTAAVIVEAIIDKGGPLDFIGHIGGDDFIAIVEPERATEIAQEVITLFEEKKMVLYSEEDVINGGIITRDRDGNTKKYDLLGIAIAIVIDQGGRFQDSAELAKHAAKWKQIAKQDQKSSFIISE